MSGFFRPNYSAGTCGNRRHRSPLSTPIVAGRRSPQIRPCLAVVSGAIDASIRNFFLSLPARRASRVTRVRFPSPLSSGDRVLLPLLGSSFRHDGTRCAPSGTVMINFSRETRARTRRDEDVTRPIPLNRDRVAAQRSSSRTHGAAAAPTRNPPRERTGGAGVIKSPTSMTSVGGRSSQIPQLRIPGYASPGSNFLRR